MTFHSHYHHGWCLGSDWDNAKKDVNAILVQKWFSSRQLHLRVAMHLIFCLQCLLKILLFKYCSIPQYCFQLKLCCFTGSWNRPNNSNVFLLAEKKILLCCALFCHPNIVLKNTITAELLSNIYFYWENSTVSVVAWCYHLIIFSFPLYDGKLQFNEVYI